MVAINISPSGVQIAPNVVQYINLPVNYNNANSFNANTFAGRSSMSTPASISPWVHYCRANQKWQWRHIVFTIAK